MSKEWNSNSWMRQQMTAATLAGQSKVVQRPTLGRELGVIGEVHQLGVRCTSLGAAVLLNQTVKLLPLAGDGEIAGIAADRNWEIHCAVLLV